RLRQTHRRRNGEMGQGDQVCRHQAGLTSSNKATWSRSGVRFGVKTGKPRTEQLTSVCPSKADLRLPINEYTPLSTDTRIAWRTLLPTEGASTEPGVQSERGELHCARVQTQSVSNGRSGQSPLLRNWRGAAIRRSRSDRGLQSGALAGRR